MIKKLHPLFDEMEKTPPGAFFNPWFDIDQEHDMSDEAPGIRRKQSETYLADRLASAKYLCIGEALGYQGGHFTGIAMTSERILLGHQYEPHGIPSDGVFRNLEPARTSKPEVIRKGFTEPTATIMWKALYQMGADPFEIVLWNALAWHPYDPGDGLLSNRTPTGEELDYGLPALKEFLALFPDRTVVAVGKKCTCCLGKLGIDYHEVRHPANGGASKFRRQFKKILNSET